jgi:hypothetical protein
MVALVKIDAGTSMTRFTDADDLSTWATGPVPPSGTVEGNFTVSGTRLFNWQTTSRTLSYIDAVTAGAFTVGPTTSGAGIGRPNAMAGNGTDVLLCDTNGSLWGSSDNGTTITKRAELNFDLVRDSMDVNGSRFVVAGDSKSTIYPVAYYTDDVGATATASTWPSGSPAQTPSNVRYCGDGRWLIAFLFTSTGQSALYRSADNGASFVPVTLPANLYFDNRRQSIAAVELAGSQTKLTALIAEYGKVTGNQIDKAQTLADVTKLQAIGFADTTAELNEFVLLNVTEGVLLLETRYKNPFLAIPLEAFPMTDCPTL